jgi:hypothetical protein
MEVGSEGPILKLEEPESLLPPCHWTILETSAFSILFRKFYFLLLLDTSSILTHRLIKHLFLFTFAKFLFSSATR